MTFSFCAVSFASLFFAGIVYAQNFFVFVSNERSGDVSVIDSVTDEVDTTFSVGKRPRGIHPAPDGSRVFVALSGSPRMAAGADQDRAPADKTADGLGVIDSVARKLIAF